MLNGLPNEIENGSQEISIEMSYCKNITLKVFFGFLSRNSLVFVHTVKGLSHEIFRPVFWHVWTHLGLNVNRFCFQNCYDTAIGSRRIFEKY